MSHQSKSWLNLPLRGRYIYNSPFVHLYLSVVDLKLVLAIICLRICVFLVVVLLLPTCGYIKSI